MALFNEILAARFNAFLQKHFSMKGSAPSPQLAGELMPVLIFLSGVESLFHQGWERFGSAGQIGAVALQNSVFRLRNPVGSNVIAVIENLIVSADIAANFSIEMTSPGVDLVGSLPRIPIDTRGRTNSTLVATTGNNVPIGASSLMWVTLNALVSFSLITSDPQTLVLNPGRTLEIKTSTVNTFLSVSVVWRERLLEESERK